MLTEQQIEDFLHDMNKLARKHKIAIHGCGCCGSPYLYAIEEKLLKDGYKYETDSCGDNLSWRKENQE